MEEADVQLWTPYIPQENFPSLQLLQRVFAYLNELAHRYLSDLSNCWAHFSLSLSFWCQFRFSPNFLIRAIAQQRGAQ